MDRTTPDETSLAIRDRIYLYIDEDDGAFTLGIRAQRLDDELLDLKTVLIRGGENLLTLAPPDGAKSKMTENILYGLVTEEWTDSPVADTELHALAAILASPYVIVRFDGTTSADLLLSREQKQALANVLTAYAALKGIVLPTLAVTQPQPIADLQARILGHWSDDRFPDVSREYNTDGTVTMVTSNGMRPGIYSFPADGEISITFEDEYGSSPMHRRIDIVGDTMLLSLLPDASDDEFWAFTRITD